MSRRQGQAPKPTQESPQGEDLRANVDKLRYDIPKPKRQEINKDVSCPD
jgi:hypothetical protein